MVELEPVLDPKLEPELKVELPLKVEFELLGPLPFWIGVWFIWAAWAPTTFLSSFGS